MHRDDIYKVGYTVRDTPEGRVAKLNTEQRNRTSQIGFFSLHYACAMMDAYGCEQQFFRRVGRLLESDRKEFVNAPLEIIVGELLQIQKADNAKFSATGICKCCQMVIRFCPLPQTIQQCPACGEWFGCDQRNDLVHGVDESGRKRSYKVVQPVKTLRSPLGNAFIRLKLVVDNYWKGLLSEDDFIKRLDVLMKTEFEIDREASDSRVKPIRKRRVKPPGLRIGWMDCPDCLSSIDLTQGAICVECGWKLERD